MITEVAIRLGTKNGKTGFLGEAEIIVAGLILSKLKIIQGKERVFIDFPEADVVDCCRNCNADNPVTRQYCGRCGNHLGSERYRYDRSGKPITKRHVIRPESGGVRIAVEAAILQVFRLEVQASQLPGWSHKWHHYRVGESKPLRESEQDFQLMPETPRQA